MKFCKARSTSQYHNAWVQRSRQLYCADDFSRNGAQAVSARRYSHCCRRPASCILMEIAACSFSQMRGTPRKIEGATSRRSSCTVRMDSPKFTCEPT